MPYAIYTSKPSLYCKQVIDTSTFQSCQHKNYTLHFTNSTVKANSSFFNGMHICTL